MTSPGRPRTVLTSPHIGSVIEQRRHELALSRAAVADSAGVSVNTLEKVEQGVIADPGVLRIAPVCRELGLSLDALVATVLASDNRSNRMELVSLGYEGRTAAELIEEAQRAGVEVVADVRLNPISRKPGLSKTKLAAALAAVGIEYVHFRRLGNPKTNREPFWNGQPDVGRERLREHFDAGSWQDIADLRDRARSSVVGVLCFEADEERCHRKLVLDEVRANA